MFRDMDFLCVVLKINNDSKIIEKYSFFILSIIKILLFIKIPHQTY